MEKRVLIIFLILPLIVNWHWFEAHAKKNKKGVDAYKQKKYSDALKEFLAAKGIKPELDVLKSNTAVTLYQMKKYKEALNEFSGIDQEKTELSKADYHYNMGNTYFRMNQLDKALESYKKSLIENGTSIDAKKNYEITLKKLKDQKKKKQKQDDKKDQDKKDKDKNKDQKKKNQKDKDKKKDQQKNKQQQKQNPQQKHKNLMNYLNQKEKKQQKKKKRVAGAVVTREKDW